MYKNKTKIQYQNHRTNAKKVHKAKARYNSKSGGAIARAECSSQSKMQKHKESAKGKANSKKK